MTDNETSPGRFKPGRSGNPKGKPKGCRNRATTAVIALMEGGAEEITLAVIDQARSGNMAAARLILDRLAPPARERRVSINLPETDTAEGIAAAARAVLEAVAGGELTPGEGSALSGIVEGRRRAMETQELERRITTLEGKSQ